MGDCDVFGQSQIKCPRTGPKLRFSDVPSKAQLQDWATFCIFKSLIIHFWCPYLGYVKKLHLYFQFIKTISQICINPVEKRCCQKFKVRYQLQDTCKKCSYIHHFAFRIYLLWSKFEINENKSWYVTIENGT